MPTQYGYTSVVPKNFVYSEVVDAIILDKDTDFIDTVVSGILRTENGTTATPAQVATWRDTYMRGAWLDSERGMNKIIFYDGFTTISGNDDWDEFAKYYDNSSTPEAGVLFITTSGGSTDEWFGVEYPTSRIVTGFTFTITSGVPYNGDNLISYYVGYTDYDNSAVWKYYGGDLSTTASGWYNEGDTQTITAGTQTQAYNYPLFAYTNSGTISFEFPAPTNLRYLRVYFGDIENMSSGITGSPVYTTNGWIEELVITTYNS